MFTAALLTIGKKQKHKISTHSLKLKMSYILTMDHYSAIKKIKSTTEIVILGH